MISRRCQEGLNGGERRRNGLAFGQGENLSGLDPFGDVDGEGRGVREGGGVRRAPEDEHVLIQCVPIAPPREGTA